MNERYLEAVNKLKDKIASLETELKATQKNFDDYKNENNQLKVSEIARRLEHYHIVDDTWYYDDFNTGIPSRGIQGPEGKIGPKGDPFTFDDLTPEQIVLLTGADGLDGKDGIDGKDGLDGKDGIDGKDGKDGVNGKDAETPEFEVGEIKSVSTYDPAKVSLKKKKNKYIINMDIPRGRPGSNGDPGSNGSSATINGLPAVNIVSGNNIDVEQQDETLIINSLINPFTLIVVDELPEENISSSAIYFTPSDDPGTTDIFDEWVYVNKGTEEEPVFVWEHLGTTAVDLTGYVKTTDYAPNTGSLDIPAGVVRCYNSSNYLYGIKMLQNGFIGTQKASDTDIDSKTNDYKPIVPSNFDYAMSTNYLTGSSAPTTSTVAPFVGALYLDTTNNVTYQCTAITTVSDVTTYTWERIIRGSEVATSNQLGLVSGNNYYGFSVDQRDGSKGYVFARAIDYNTYKNANGGYFIGKGTLEAVLGARFITLTQAQYDSLETKDADAYYYIVEE